VALLRRGINEALAVRTAADNSRREGKEAASSAAVKASGDAAAAAQNGAGSNGSSEKKKKKQKQVELFVLDGKHAYGLRAEALARAVSPDLPCTECPLVKQQQELDVLASMDESLLSSGMLSSSSSSVASVADVDAAGAAAAVPVAGLNGSSSSKGAAAAAVNASVGSNTAGGPGSG
jgi:hypothetical protein